jgi:hypothetical protein
VIVMIHLSLRNHINLALAVFGCFVYLTRNTPQLIIDLTETSSPLSFFIFIKIILVK